MLKPGLTFCSILFSAVCIVGQSTRSSLFNNSDSTTVSGKIKGYKINQEEQFINYYVYDITGHHKKFAVPIHKNGEFSFRFLQQYEGDYSLQYGINFMKVYAVPGEEIKIEIDNKEAQELYHFTSTFKISGQSASISRHILQFFEQYLPLMYKRAMTAERKLPYEELIKRTHKDLQEDLAFLTTYIVANDPPAAFKTWSKNYLTYEAAALIVGSPFREKPNTTITDSELIAFLSPIHLQVDNGWNNASYYEFLNRLASGFHMISINNEAYFEKWRDSSFNRAALALDKADLYFTGTHRELIYYDVYSHSSNNIKMLAWSNMLWKRFDETINDNLLQHLLESKKNNGPETFTVYNVVERIKNYPVDPKIKKSLLAILQKEKGRYVYIDFWGSWCGPCMAQMPHYKAFIDELKDQPITFLFLAVETPLKEMKAIQEKYAIPGKFIALNKNETDIANDVFEFSGYPSHFFIDPAGNLLTKKLSGVNNKQEAVVQIKWLMR